MPFPQLTHTPDALGAMNYAELGVKVPVDLREDQTGDRAEDCAYQRDDPQTSSEVAR
jgi:hypothetical protein